MQNVETCPRGLLCYVSKRENAYTYRGKAKRLKNFEIQFSFLKKNGLHTPFFQRCTKKCRKDSFCSATEGQIFRFALNHEWETD